MSLSERIANWIKAQVENSGKKGIILGLSGGIDSAVVAALCKKAVGDSVFALMLPCGSNQDDLKAAHLVAKKFNIKTKEVCLDEMFKDFSRLFPEANALAKANLKPRLRMSTLYYFANSLDYIVTGTGNKSELMVGYFTKYGDGGTDILPLGDLLKKDVRELAKELDIPNEIIKRPPSAGLWQGQTDEKEMGISYEELDAAIIAIETGDAVTIDKDVLKKVKSMIAGSEHKRLAIPIFKMYPVS